jgi:hypothetical protein
MFDDTEQKIETQVSPENVAPEQKDPRQEQTENNIRIMRERWEQEKKRSELAEKRARDLEEQLAGRRSEEPRNQPAAEQEEDIPDDEIIDGKTHKKQLQRIKQELKQELQQMRAQTEFESAERSLRDKYTDFGSIVNEDTLKTFQAVYPEEYISMLSNPNPYARMKTAYTFISNLGIVERKQPAYDQGKNTRNPAPRAAASSSMVSSGPTTPLANFPGIEMEGRVVLTKQQMDEIDRDTQEKIRRFRGGY